MRDALGYWWLKIKLLWSIALFLFALLRAELQSFKTLLVGLFLLILVAGQIILVLFWPNNQLFHTSSALPTITLNAQDKTQETIFRWEAEEKLQQLEEQLEENPTHRDILINTALLHQALGNQEEANELFTRAKTLDPNNQLFQEKSE